MTLPDGEHPRMGRPSDGRYAGKTGKPLDKAPDSVAGPTLREAFRPTLPAYFRMAVAICVLAQSAQPLSEAP